MTPSLRGGSGRASAGTPPNVVPARRSLRRDELLGLGEVLVRGAVAVVGERHPLARGPAARRRAALERVAVDVVAVLGLLGDPVLGGRDVRGYDLPDTLLLADREVEADVVEERSRGPCEVVAGGFGGRRRCPPKPLHTPPAPPPPPARALWGPHPGGRA